MQHNRRGVNVNRLFGGLNWLFKGYLEVLNTLFIRTYRAAQLPCHWVCHVQRFNTFQHPAIRPQRFCRMTHKLKLFGNHR